MTFDFTISALINNGMPIILLRVINMLRCDIGSLPWTTNITSANQTPNKCNNMLWFCSSHGLNIPFQVLELPWHVAAILDHALNQNPFSFFSYVDNACCGI
jgi:hypothetical protein